MSVKNEIIIPTGSIIAVNSIRNSELTLSTNEMKDSAIYVANNYLIKEPLQINLPDVKMFDNTYINDGIYEIIGTNLIKDGYHLLMNNFKIDGKTIVDNLKDFTLYAVFNNVGKYLINEKLRR